MSPPTKQKATASATDACYEANEMKRLIAKKAIRHLITVLQKVPRAL